MGYLGSGLALKNPACGGKVVLIIGSIFSFPSFIIYAIGTYFLLIAANIYVEIIKTSFNTAVGTDDHVFTKCLDDSRAMFSSAGVGCLIACIGCLGAFISAICASCGICKHETKQKQAALPVPGTQPGTQMTNIAVATPVFAAAAQALPSPLLSSTTAIQGSGWTRCGAARPGGMPSGMGRRRRRDRMCDKCHLGLYFTLLFRS